MICSPCKHCLNRKPACHDTCEGYTQYKEDLAGYKAQMHKDYDKVYTVTGERNKSRWAKRKGGMKW